MALNKDIYVASANMLGKSLKLHRTHNAGDVEVDLSAIPSSTRKLTWYEED